MAVLVPEVCEITTKKDRDVLIVMPILRQSSIKVILCKADAYPRCERGTLRIVIGQHELGLDD